VWRNITNIDLAVFYAFFFTELAYNYDVYGKDMTAEKINFIFSYPFSTENKQNTPTELKFIYSFLALFEELFALDNFFYLTLLLHIK
jgi:hypothetical protein